MMKVKVSNKIFVKDYSMELIEYCHKHLVLPNPNYHIAEKMGRWVGNLEKYLYLYEANGSNLVLPFGTLDEIWQPYINGKNENYELDFATPQALSMVGDIKLYPYQTNAVASLKSAKNGILEAPCGSGKTQIGIGLIKALGQKALWVTHTTDLLKQSMERAKQYFEGDFGTITDGKVHIGGDITFATIQTLAKLDLTQYNKEWNVVIVDECHRAAGSPTKVMQFYKVLSHLKARHKYGLSATLDRTDGLIRSVFALLGSIKFVINSKEVDDKIIKATHKIIPTDLEEDIERYCDTDGTMSYTKLIDYITNNEQRNDVIIKNISSKPFGHHLVLSHRVEHLRVLKRLLDALNIKSSIVYASTPNDQRDYILDLARNGNLPVLLATYNLAKEGLDIPILDTLHLTTPVKNKAIVLQSVGRVERNIENKPTPEVYDYLDINIGYCKAMGRTRKNIINKRK